MASANRSYIAGKFLLELEGVTAGFVKSVDGGGVAADVLTEASGLSYYTKKHIGQPKYEDFVLSIGFTLAKDVYEWIAESWQGNYLRKDGSVMAADYNLNVQSQRDFSQALITETTIPAMDASSKDAAYLTLKFSPEYTRYKKANGKVTGSEGKGQMKLFLPSNFRLEIDGLDCTKVTRIDTFTVKQAVITDDVGDARDLLREPGKLEFPNLKITLAEAGAQAWLDWFDDFVIAGNNGDSKEKNGSLTLFAPDFKTELAKVNFFNLGIFKLAPEKVEANSDAMKRLSAELYCERMEFIAIGASTPSAPKALKPDPRKVQRTLNKAKEGS